MSYIFHIIKLQIINYLYNYYLILGNYFARAHPDVRVNKKTEMEVLSDFLKSIENYCIYTAHKGQYLSI